MTCVSQDYIAISYCMHFVDLVLNAELVESRKQFRQKLNDFLWILYIVTELCETYHISEEKSYILKLIYNSLIVFNSLENQWRDKISQKIVSSLDFNVNDQFSVVRFSLRHLILVRLIDQNAVKENQLKEKGIRFHSQLLGTT